MSKKRILSKLAVSKVDEISNVNSPANGLKKFDVIKSDEVFEDVKKSIEEYYNEMLSPNILEAYTFTCKDAISVITYSDLTKEQKIQEYIGLFTMFLKGVESNPLIKSEDGKMLFNPKSEQSDLEKQDEKQEKKMEEDKIGLLEKVISFLKNEKAEEVKKFEETIEEKEVVEKQEEVIEDSQDEKSEDVEKQEEDSSEPVEKTEEIEKDAQEDVLEEAVDKQEENDVEIQKSEESAELIEIQKEAEEAKSKIEDLQKQLKTIELEKAEQAEKIEKQELLNIVKSELEFAKGTPEDNTNILFELRKSVSEEQYNWIFENFKKQSEKIEKALEPAGSDVKEEPKELTASQKIEKITQKIQKEQGISNRAKAYRKALDENPQLAQEAYRESN